MRVYQALSGQMNEVRMVFEYPDLAAYEAEEREDAVDPGVCAAGGSDAVRRRDARVRDLSPDRSPERATGAGSPATKGAEALVLLAAGRAALEVGAQSGNRRVGVVAGELELDVAVELVEALVAADLRPAGPRVRPRGCSRSGRFITSPPHRRVSSDSRARPGACAACVERRAASCRARRASCSSRSARTSIGTPFSASATRTRAGAA